MTPSREPFRLGGARQGLLVVDLQNDFVRQAAPQEVPDARAIIPVVRRLLDAFRAAGLPVVYTRFIAGPEHAYLWPWSPECGPEQRSCWRGVMRRYPDWPEPLEGPAVVPELAPAPGEAVVDKHGYGGFHGTDLDEVLGARGLRQVVVVGTVTQICVEETVREGFHRGLEMVVVRDAVASFDPELARATLRNLAAKFARVESSATVLSVLKESGT
jgi:nicotinamidase-related amidase